MTTKRIEKQALVAATITFTQSDDEIDQPSPSMINNLETYRLKLKSYQQGSRLRWLIKYICDKLTTLKYGN